MLNRHVSPAATTDSSIKAALNHAVPNMAHELAQYRVNVNAVLPG
jgi:NAD(P)-dependent dehydrogenase (short-subunit alcohol dehydrogenase family)